MILDGSARNGKRLGVILDLLGVAWRSYGSLSQLRGVERNGELHAILAPVSAMNEVRPPDGSSAFFYGAEGMPEEKYPSLIEETINAVVSKDWPAFTGSMQGLSASVRVRFGDRVAKLSAGDSIIIDTERGPAFFCRDHGSSRSFVSCSSEIPDLGEQVEGKGYDVRKHFLSAVPLLLYLRWAFRDTCWQASDSGACWIIDDPPLRTKYGFCDFRLLDAQMKEHSFSTNIALIPWNVRRTSSGMASLVKSSQGRLSVSVHGCDHTAGEFGSENADELRAKTHLAQQRMERHRLTTGVEHDAVMIFPQGIFSRESLRTLQQHQFAAAVNTEGWPLRRNGETLTVADTWRVAILKYGSFPLFTRRYPAEGLANFAFDLLLGKPCLVVEHQGFFKDDHAEVVRFARALNSLNANLHWRGLGDVIRGSFQWRRSADGVIRVRMFANELVLKNGGSEERIYRIEKSDEGSVGVQEVTANGRALEWQTDGYVISFTCKVPSGTEVLLRVRYTPPEKAAENMHTISSTVKVAGRRYLSEFRDNFLSRHDRLMAIAQKARRIGGGSR
jgi:hypothetical protein